MANALGVPRVVLRYWAVLGFFLVPISILYGIIMTPAVLVSYFAVPEFSGYVFYSGVSWIFIYTTVTVALFRVTNSRDLLTFARAKFEQEKWVFSALILVLVHSMILAGALAGFLVGTTVSPLAGVVVAVAYPIAEFRFILRYPTPSHIVVKSTLKVAKLFGVAKSISFDDFLSDLLVNETATPRHAPAG